LKLHNEFTVRASLEDTWRTLLDIERVATCLPGAKLESGGEDGVYRGQMKMRVGPMTVDYRGTAQLEDVDEDAHTASIAVKAREVKGQGTAAAVIRNRLTAEDGSTRVITETDLKLTGRVAQFGRGIVEDVAGTMMGQFAERLESEIEAAPGVVTGDAGTPTDETAADAALDLGDVLLKSPAVRRAGLVVAAALAVIAVVVLARRPGRRFRFDINLRR
jgi:carbon monoxide dehydrogenase subunit G